MGQADAIKYLSAVKPKIVNMRPIVAERGVNADPTQDQYFKGALMINTLRSVIDDDAKWFAAPPRLLPCTSNIKHHD